MPRTPQELDVLRHFGRSKVAADSTIPTIIGGAGGAYTGTLLADILAAKYPAFRSKALEKATQAAMTGVGGFVGKSIGDAYSDPPQSDMPPGAPYSVDPTSEDIPSWALQGARYLQPFAERTGSFWQDDPRDRPRDIIGGEIPGYGFAEGAREGRGVRGALKGGFGSILGGVGGAAFGYTAGRGIAASIGHDPRVPLVNMPLSQILAGLGATIGSTKTFQHAIGA